LFSAVTLMGVLLLTVGARRAMSTEQQMKVPDNGDYSKFQHSSTYHARLPCLLCHRRDSDAAVPTMPGSAKHAPCAGCHVKQFADSANAICTICHDNEQAGTLKALPKLNSFRLRFDHASHINLDLSCATCHRPSRGGVAMSIPAGFSAHETCFQCHGPDATSGEKNISSCGVCHEPGRPRPARQMAAAFRMGFSHAKHNQDERLSCSDCHRVRGGPGNDVTAPRPLNHHAGPGSFSCLSCHNGKKAFGGDDFSACKRCHQGASWRF